MEFQLLVTAKPASIPVLSLRIVCHPVDGVMLPMSITTISFMSKRNLPYAFF